MTELTGETLENLLIEIRRRADADGKKIQIKPTHILVRQSDLERVARRRGVTVAKLIEDLEALSKE